MIGRRLPDRPISQLPAEMQAGDYWKIVDQAGAAKPPDEPYPSNLAGTCWYVVAPNHEPEGGWMLGRLEKHTVREHDDGTISVRPGDGSSNSILITGARGRRWHGYIEHGVWSEVA